MLVETGLLCSCFNSINFLFVSANSLLFEREDSLKCINADTRLALVEEGLQEQSKELAEQRKELAEQSKELAETIAHLRRTIGLKFCRNIATLPMKHMLNSNYP
jgi:septal ring factor EnvC (AmiA/AmiB activator)